MKKNWLLWVCLIAVLILSLGVSAEKPTLNVLFMQTFMPQVNTLIQQQINDWAKANNTNVNVEFISLKDLNYKIASSAELKTGADIVLLNGTGPALYSDSLVDVSQLANKIGKDNGGFYPVCEESSKIGNAWRGIPIFAYAHVLVYRKDLLKEANEKVPQTWEDLIRVSKKITDPSKGRYGFGVSFTRGNDGPQFTYGLLWSYGFKMTGKDGKNLAFDSKQTEAGLKYIQDLYNSGSVPPGVTGWDDASNNQAFLSEKIGMTVNSASIIAGAKVNRPDMYPNIGHALYPAGPNGRFSYAEIYSLGIFKHSKQIKQAEKLIAHLFTKENYSQTVTTGEAAQGLTLRDYAKLPMWKDEDMKAVLDTMDNCHAIGYPGPVTKPANAVYVQSIVVDMMNRMLLNGLSPEKTVDEAAAKIKSIYDEYK